ncbi:MAG: hypothetical protein P4K93_02595 [Terracidiphilus sp.]|nr:hypothetical protein [Terracidiphilus sp.]MDR3797012.1 hypothetical protein [Terracidiphilus sp.]
MDAPETVVQPALGAAPKAELRPSPEGLECLSRLARTYVWWKTPEEAMRFPERVAAQVLNLGTWDDLTALVEAADEPYLRQVLRGAEAGQLDARSWHYWHYRLGLAEYGVRPVPPMPTRKMA